MTTVTAKSTKDAIWEEVVRLREELKAAKSAKLDPAADAKVKKDEGTISKAEHAADFGVDKVLLEISNNVTKILADAAGVVTNSVADYNEVKAAIELKRQELSELFQVEKELLDLAAIVNTKENLAAKYDADHKERVAAAEAKLKEQEDFFKARQSEYNGILEKQRNDDIAARKRDNDEYKYNFDRQKKIENDAWEDTKAARLKELDAKAEVLAAKEAALDAEQAEIDSLKAKVAEIPTLVAEASEKAAAAAKKSAETGFNIEKGYLKKDAENEKALADSKIQTLTSTIEDLRAQLASANTKLDAAYIEIKDMAAKTVESAGNSRMIASLESLVKDGKNNSK